MRLNQVTVTMPDLDAGWRFYSILGLRPIVDARPRYARFVCPCIKARAAAALPRCILNARIWMKRSAA
jgi:hypothetical protein